MSELSIDQIGSVPEPKVMRFPRKSSFGQVLRVDTARVFIDATDHDQVSALQVSGLVAIQGAIGTEYLIGSIDGVFRDVALDEVPIVEDELDDIISSLNGLTDFRRDLVRIVLVGMYSIRHGNRTGFFRRGTDSFPSVDRQCWTITGTNLNCLMTTVAAEIEQRKQLNLGTLVVDPNVLAIANGDAFFQRHCAVVGSTGSGKSWATATLIEQAAKLQHPNILLLTSMGNTLRWRLLTKAAHLFVAPGSQSAAKLLKTKLIFSCPTGCSIRRKFKRC